MVVRRLPGDTVAEPVWSPDALRHVTRYAVNAEPLSTAVVQLTDAWPSPGLASTAGGAAGSLGGGVVCGGVVCGGSVGGLVVAWLVGGGGAGRMIVGGSAVGTVIGGGVVVGGGVVGGGPVGTG